MNKSKFKSIFFFYFLIVLLSGLLIFNIYTIIISHDFYIILPILIQLFLLSFVIIKHSKIKLLLKIWSLVFFIIAPTMQIVGKLLKDASYDYQFFDIKLYITPCIMLLFGCFIFYFSSKTIEQNNIDKITF